MGACSDCAGSAGSVGSLEGSCGCAHGGVWSVIETSSESVACACALFGGLIWPFLVLFFPAMWTAQRESMTARLKCRDCVE
jgi:hypothetical protein